MAFDSRFKESGAKMSLTTPLIEITELGFANGNRVFAKCENHQPYSHSHYDRVYERLFDRLPAEIHRKRGEYQLIETSSGNAGTAFAHFCELYGFEGTVVFPKSVRPQRLATVRTPSVKTIISKLEGYMKGAQRTMIEEMRAVAASGRTPHIVNHSQTWESVIAMKACGEEICAQLEEFGAKPDVFVSALGNGTSTSGVGLALRKHNPGVEIIGFEPRCAPVFSGGLEVPPSAATFSESTLTGTGVWGIRFPNLLPNLLNRIVLVDEFEAPQSTWRGFVALARSEFGQSIGRTSAAAIGVARAVAERVSGRNIVVEFYEPASLTG